MAIVIDSRTSPGKDTTWFAHAQCHTCGVPAAPITRTGGSIIEVAATAAQLATAHGWHCTPGEHDTWHTWCHICAPTKDQTADDKKLDGVPKGHRGSRPQPQDPSAPDPAPVAPDQACSAAPDRYPVGTVLLCIGNGPAYLNLRGRLVQVARITAGPARGPCHWVREWRRADPGRRRRDGARPAGFDASVTSPVPASCLADYIPWEMPDDYAGQSLLDPEPDPETAARLAALPRPMASVCEALTARAKAGEDLCQAGLDSECHGPTPEQPAPAPHYQPDQVYHLALDLLACDPDQPRCDFPAAGLAALAEDLRVTGQETPITFRVVEQDAAAPRLYIVHGERRWRAAKLAGLPTLAAVLDRHQGDREPDADRLIRQAVHNEQHEYHTAWDWACLCRRLSAAPNHLGPSEIARELARRGIRGKTRPVVSTLIHLHRLPVWAIDYLRRGILSVAHGRVLLPHIQQTDIMDVMHAWIADNVDHPPQDQDAAPPPSDAQDPGAPEDPPDDIDDDPATRRRCSVAGLRAQLRWCYARHYPSLEAGSYLNGVFVRPDFDWKDSDDLCQTCARRVTLEAINYCTNPDCLVARNAALRASLEGDDAVEDGAPQPLTDATAADTTSPITFDRGASRAALDATKARVAALRIAIHGNLKQCSRRDLLALVLWQYILHDYRLSMDLRAGSIGFVRDLLDDDQAAERSLRKLFDLQLKNLYDEESLKTLADALRPALPPAQETA